MNISAFFDPLTGMTHYRDEAGAVIAWTETTADGGLLLRDAEGAWSGHADAVGDGKWSLVDGDGTHVGWWSVGNDGESHVQLNDGTQWASETWDGHSVMYDGAGQAVMDVQEHDHGPTDIHYNDSTDDLGQLG
jgi:hypothetical protein